MTLQELEQVMIEYGIAIKAIPNKMKSVYEKSHINEYPNGYIKYLEEYKREMLIVEYEPKNAGKFVIVDNTGTSSSVWFVNDFYDSIEDAVESLLKNKEVKIWD